MSLQKDLSTPSVSKHLVLDTGDPHESEAMIYIDHSDPSTSSYDMETHPKTRARRPTSEKGTKAQATKVQNNAVQERMQDFSLNLAKVSKSLQLVVSHCLSLNVTARLPTSGLINIERPATFTLFPKLPPELRVNIWRYARSGPRLIEPNERHRKLEYPRLFPRGDFCGEFSSTMDNCTRCPPALLHVNRESRFEALKDYELVLASELFDISAKDPSSKIYFNFDLDTIYISEATFFSNSPFPFDRRGSQQRVKHLAVDLGSLFPPPGIRQWVWYRRSFSHLTNLQSLTLVRDWTTWNLAHIWAHWSVNYGGSVDGVNGFCFRDRIAVEAWLIKKYREEKELWWQKYCQQNPHLFPGHMPVHPEFQVMAYFGTGELVAAHGRYLLEEEQGPPDETRVRGTEVKHLPRKIRDALEQLRAFED